MARWEEFIGKTVIVTGAANGIGRAIALLFRSEGAKVIAIDRDAAQLNELLLAGTGSHAIKPILLDCTDRVAVETTFVEFMEAEPPIDILVNNIGSSARERSAQFYASQPEVWDFVLGTCLGTMMNITRQVVPQMRERKSGKIINISSDAAFSGVPTATEYCAAKSSVVGFTRGLAVDLAPFGINVNVVCPGLTRTRAIAANPADQIKASLAMTPLGVMAEPEDIANTVAFLASDRSRCIVGQAILVNGGRIMH